MRCGGIAEETIDESCDSIPAVSLSGCPDTVLEHKQKPEMRIMEIVQIHFDLTVL
jgi:hypothetical protein